MTSSAAGATTRARLAIGGVALAGVALIAGCTSSSSNPSGPTGSAAPSAASSTPGTPVNTGTATAPKHQAVYTKVTAAQAKKMEVPLARAPGVQNTAYTPENHHFTVYFRANATKKQRKVAKKIVRQTIPAPTSGGHKKH